MSESESYEVSQDKDIEKSNIKDVPVTVTPDSKEDGVKNDPSFTSISNESEEDYSANFEKSTSFHSIGSSKSSHSKGEGEQRRRKKKHNLELSSDRTTDNDSPQPLSKKERMKKRKSTSKLDKRISKVLGSTLKSTKKYSTLFFYEYEHLVDTIAQSNEEIKDLILFPEDDISIIHEEKKIHCNFPKDLKDLIDNSLLSNYVWLSTIFSIFEKQTWTIVKFNYAEYGMAKVAVPSSLKSKASFHPKVISLDKKAHSKSNISSPSDGYSKRRKKTPSSANLLKMNVSIPPLTQEILNKDAENRKSMRKQLFFHYNARAKTLGIQEIIDFSRSKVQNPFEFIGSPKKYLYHVHFKDLLIQDVNEPLFCSASLHDVQEKTRLSEDFDFELNSTEHRRMLKRNESKDVDPESLCTSCIFKMTNEPKSSLYMIVLIMKLLSEEEKEKGLFGLITKKKELKDINEGEKISHKYKQQFCWAAIPLSADANQKAQSFNTFFLMKESFTFEDIYEAILNEKKFKTLNGALNFTIRRGDDESDSELEKVMIDPSLQVSDKFDPSSLEPNKNKKVKAVRVIQEFGQQNLDFYLSYINNLYIYPKSLSFKTNKPCIQITAKLKDNDKSPNDKGLKVIYGKAFSKKFHSTAITSVSYHEKHPGFTDEIKMKLPTIITPQHHILFTIYDVDPKKYRKSVLGYAIMPLLGSDTHLGFGKDDLYLPICQELPEEYLSPLSQSKIRWMDSKKYYLQLSTQLISSIYSIDQNLSKLFFSFSKNPKKGDLKYDNLVESVSAIRDTDRVTLFKYFPTIFTLLISIICSNDEIISKEAFLSLIKISTIVSTTTPGKYSFYLRAYISCLFDNNLIIGSDASSPNLLFSSFNNQMPFEALIKCYLRELQLQNPDVVQYENSWFILGLITKSMILYLHDRNLLQTPRKKRFSDDFQANLQKFVACLLYESGARDTIDLVMSCALFIKDLFSIVDRGIVFSIIYEYLEATRSKRSTLSESNKFALLKILTNYEHFVQLNLPRFEKALQLKEDLSLSVNSMKDTHYLIGQIIEETNRNFIQSVDDNILRNQSIIVLRNILMKHEFDKRLSDPIKQTVVASMYFPFIYFVVNDPNVINSMNKSEKEEWLICFLYILRNIPMDAILNWWGKESQRKQVNLFTILEHCIMTFQQAYLRKQTDFLVIDIICEIVDKYNGELNSFSSDEESGGGEVAHPALRKIVHIFHLLFNRFTIEDTTSIQFLYTPMQLFIERCSSGLVNNVRSDLLGTLVSEFVIQCNHPSPHIQYYGANMLYIFMKKAYEVSGSFQRMRMELGVAVSRLVGSSSGVKQGYAQLQSCVDAIKKYSLEHDDETVNTLVVETLDHLIKLLDYRTKIEKNSYDPEMVQDLYANIERGYQSNPELRVTWIDNLAEHHILSEDFEEAAQCKLHIASLIAQYLMRDGSSTAHKMRTKLPSDFIHFPLVAPNLVNELPLTKEPFVAENWHLKYLLGFLNQAAILFDKATRYELAIEVYHLIAMIHKMEKKYDDMISTMKDDIELCERLSDKDNPPDRIYPVYFKVGFYGSKWDDLDGKQFIYKKTGKYNLSIFKKQLESQYERKFEKGELVIMSTNEVISRSQLDPNKCYIQMTGVQPYFEAHEADDRVTKADHHFKINQFLFETPFTEDGSNYSDDMSKQKKKKSIFKTQHYFPYTRSRLLVTEVREIILSPIENAIENIETQIAKLRGELESYPTRPKSLQQVIQGSVVPMVNPGPLKICDIFLSPGTVKQKKYDVALVKKLVEKMQYFIKLCGFAIKLNKSFIDEKQIQFQKMVEMHYDDLEKKVKDATSLINKEIAECK